MINQQIFKQKQQLKLIQMHMHYKQTIVINKKKCMCFVSQQTFNKSNNSNDQYNTIFHKSIGKTKLWRVRINCSNALCIACIIKALKVLRAGLIFQSQCESLEIKKKWVLEIRFRLWQQETSV